MNARTIGSFRGIPVKLHWGAVALAAVLGLLVANGVLPQLAPGWSDGAYLVAGFLAGASLLLSIFVHEAAHAVVAQRYDIQVSSLTLWLLGGVAHLEDEAPTPRAEALIAGVGPASSLALALLAAATAGITAVISAPTLLTAVLVWLAGLNAILAVFNLLPGAPLDGGRLLHAWLWKRHGDRSRATVGAARAGRGLGIMVAVFGLVEFLAGNPGGLWTAGIGWFLYAAAGQEARMGRVQGALNNLSLAEIMSPLPATMGDWAEVRDIVIEQGRTDDRIVAVDFGGNVTAVTSRRELVRVAAGAGQRNAVPARLRDLPLPKPVMLEIDNPAAAILRHHGKPIVVMDGGQAVGLVTALEIDRALALRRLTDEPQLAA
ncbi:MAG: site-2 protease family protein [Acidimicrobiia bacterium]|nr:site-2 protease family protein [Acidimicrobiia bacterium]